MNIQFYVDDMIITGDLQKKFRYLKQALAEEFEIKDLGSL